MGRQDENWGLKDSEDEHEAHENSRRVLAILKKVLGNSLHQHHDRQLHFVVSTISKDTEGARTTS